MGSHDRSVGYCEFLGGTRAVRRPPGGGPRADRGRRQDATLPVWQPHHASGQAAAFEYLQEICLRHQAAQVRAGKDADNYIALSSLSLLEHRWLKDLFRLIQICQESVRLHLGSH